MACRHDSELHALKVPGYLRLRGSKGHGWNLVGQNLQRACGAACGARQVRGG